MMNLKSTVSRYKQFFNHPKPNISTSGGSPKNVNEAISAAKDIGVYAISGRGGRLLECADGGIGCDGADESIRRYLYTITRES